MILYMYIALGQGHTTPSGQTFDVNRKQLSCCPVAASFKRRNLILYTFLMILYMYIALGQGHTTPWGQTFDVNRNQLSLCPFVLNSDFIYIFFMFHHMYTVRIVITTTQIERPPVLNDHFETLPTIFTIICH